MHGPGPLCVGGGVAAPGRVVCNIRLAGPAVHATGTIWTSLPISLIMAASQAAPLAMLSMWLIVLGHWAWTGHAGLRKALISTHGLLLLPGFLAAAVGIFALRAGAKSAAQGGGLLSPIGMFPLAIGAGVVVLALISIMLALTVVPRLRHLK
jgi:hypothetical protein